MVHFVRKVLLCQVLSPPSTTALVWRGLRPGGNGFLNLVGSWSLFTSSASDQRFWQRRCSCVSQCSQLPSGHWHCLVPVLTCFYMRCVYLVFGEGLMTVSHVKGQFSWGFAFVCCFRQFGIKDCQCIKIGPYYISLWWQLMGICVRKLTYILYTVMINKSTQMHLSWVGVLS
jgi:hypothetical protein